MDHACHSCGEEHNAKFFSMFVDDMHYIVGDCSHCSYRIEFRADDLGGGLFMPDGSPVNDFFKKEHTEHMKDGLEKAGELRIVEQTLKELKMRLK